MSEERMKVLEMLAAGKITAEEAERLLEALEAREPAEGTREQVREAAESVLGKVGKVVEQAMSFGEGGFPIPTPMAALFGRGGQVKGEPVEGLEDGVELPPDAIVEISASAGDLVVRGGRQDGRMVVEADKDSVRVGREGNRFYVACMAADLKVELPPLQELLLNHMGGAVDIGDVTGDLTVKVSGGAVDITGCRGALKGRVMGGALHVEGTVASVDLDCSGGAVELQDLALREGKHRIKHMGGALDIFLAPEASVRVLVSATGGEVEADVEPETSSDGFVGQKRTYLYGGGAATLAVSSMGGDLCIRQVAPATADRRDREEQQ